MVDVPDAIELSEPQARVLGCLMEKQAATPDAYPLTLKALVAACNQASSRDPVVDYGPNLVENTAHALKSKGLVRIVHPGRGERATKFRHVVDEALGLDDAGRALLCVLLLRGPQTLNELRTRTERLHRFASSDEVESLLDDLARRDRPLVASLERGADQKNPRWKELLRCEHSARETDRTGQAAAPVTTSPGVEPAAGNVIPPAPTDDAGVGVGGGGMEDLIRRVETLEEQVRTLRTALGDLPAAEAHGTG